MGPFAAGVAVYFAFILFGGKLGAGGGMMGGPGGGNALVPPASGGGCGCASTTPNAANTTASQVSDPSGPSTFVRNPQRTGPVVEHAGYTAEPAALPVDYSANNPLTGLGLS